MIRILASMLTVIGLQMGFTGSAEAQTADPFEDFVQTEIGARELTLDGMHRRLDLLGSEAYSREADERLDGETQGRIRSYFASRGTTAARHAVYGGRYAQDIEAWLREHPKWKARIAELDRQFRGLSSQFKAAR